MTQGNVVPREEADEMKRLILLPMLVVGCAQTMPQPTPVRPKVTGTAVDRVAILTTSLVACREHRRDELCETDVAKSSCAIVMGARVEDKPVSARDRARCPTDCLTGYLYLAALDGVLGQFPELRPDNIKSTAKQLEACASGKDLAATGRKFEAYPRKDKQ